MGSAHTNPILDTKMYQVEFARGKIMALTPNIMAESMYAKCDVDRNKYLMLEGNFTNRTPDKYTRQTSNL